MRKIILFTLLLIHINYVHADVSSTSINYGDIGFNALKNNDYPKAFYNLNLACENKNYKSCSNLGYMYAKGKGLDTDKIKAAGLYKIACDNGIFASCVNLGNLYHDGDNTGYLTRDYKKAAGLYKIACDNIYKGCEELGSIYLIEESTCRNRPEVIGCKNLGNYFLEIGLNSNKDAMKLLEKACLKGNIQCGIVGYRYTTGNSIKIDLYKAKSFIKFIVI